MVSPVHKNIKWEGKLIRRGWYLWWRSVEGGQRGRSQGDRGEANAGPAKQGRGMGWRQSRESRCPLSSSSSQCHLSWTSPWGLSSSSSNLEWFEVGLPLHHNAGGLGLQPFPSKTLVTCTSRKMLMLNLQKIPCSSYFRSDFRRFLTPTASIFLNFVEAVLNLFMKLQTSSVTKLVNLGIILGEI